MRVKKSRGLIRIRNLIVAPLWYGARSRGCATCLESSSLVIGYLGLLFTVFIQSALCLSFLAEHTQCTRIRMHARTCGPACTYARSEELVFRACICSVMRAGGFDVFSTVLSSPLLFGLAHLHHYWDLVRTQRSARSGLGTDISAEILLAFPACFLFCSSSASFPCLASASAARLDCTWRAGDGQGAGHSGGGGRGLLPAALHHPLRRIRR